MPVEFQDEPDIDVLEIEAEGMPGPANEIEITSVQTLDPDEDAYIHTEGKSPRQKWTVGLPRGKTGVRGPSVEVAVVGADLCWRPAGSDDTWAVITPMGALVGATGDSIQLRVAGGHIQWKPTLGPTWADLVDLSAFKGDKGDFAELRRSGANIEWKPSSATAWAVLFPLADIKGDKGETVVLRRTPTAIEWRQADQADWALLISLADLKGDKGDPGAPGEPLVATISDQTDTGPGGWWITRDYHGVATCNYLRAEVLAGNVAGVALRIMHNGVLHRGPISLSSGAPTIITDLGLILAKGDRVSVHRDGGTITGPWLIAVQIDGRG